MIDRIIEASARNRFLVYLLTAFATVGGWMAYKAVPKDAIPDLSDVQVIVFSEWMGRSPDLVEDQITYPIATALLAAPRVSSVRGFSMFGMSFIYVLFEDRTDIYWARSRVLEYLSKVRGQLPTDSTTYIGPDATGVGWVFQYVLVDKSGKHDISELRAFQDWHLRYWLESVEGVAECATVGGFARQYQVEVDPNKLIAYAIPLQEVMMAIRRSNNDVGGRSLELAGREYLVRGLGYIKSVSDLRKVVVGTDGRGTPILLRDIANVHLGPDWRRGAADLNGEGDVVGGIVVMRFGLNPVEVIERVKKRLAEVKGSFPEGVELKIVYDRSELINESVKTVQHTLMEEMLIVSFIIIIFLLHFRTALVPILCLPIAVIMAFIPMWGLKVGSNIMSLGGIAIAIGAMVDATIVLVENVHKRLEPLTEAGEPDEATRNETIIRATKEVARPIFFALILITAAFLPVFALEAQEGRLFKPLAYTKTFCMLFAAIVSITLAPALINIFVRGRMVSEQHHPISRVLIRWYDPVLRFVLHYPIPRTIMAVAILGVTIFPYSRLGHEFMPPLNEGTILYMPTTQPGISITAATQWLQQQDRILRQFPEVETVFGKVGKADTSTDPAPLSMVETIVELKPKNEWPRRIKPKGPWDYFVSTLQRNRPHRGLRRITWDELTEQMDMAIRTRLPGTTNAWTMPIKARIDMLTTGIRTPVGVKILGSDLKVIESLGHQLEAVFQKVPGTRSAFFESTVGGYYLDITPDREEAVRYGLTVGDVEDVIEMAVGGMNVTTTIEGTERFTVNLRYPRELREDIQRLKRVLVPTRAGGMGMGAPVPLGQVADIRFRMGPPMVRDEDAQLAGYVFVDITSKDIGGYVDQAKRAVAAGLKLPPGYALRWTGQYEFMLRVKERMKTLLPIAGILIFMLLYFTYGHWVQPVIILGSIPFATTGSIWLLYALGYNISIGVSVGFISFGGLAAATGIIMIIYLDEAYERWRREGRLNSPKDLVECVVEGAVQRVRPKMMTVMTMMMGLLPIMWGTGAGADTMKRIAAPMIGGLLTSAVLTLLDIPVFYFMWKYSTLRRELRTRPQ